MLMLHAKNYYSQPMFHGVIKRTLAQFFLRHGVYTQM